MRKSESGFIERSLHRHLGSRKKTTFKSGSTEYFTCKVVDRINSQPGQLWNKEFIFYQ